MLFCDIFLKPQRTNFTPILLLLLYTNSIWNLLVLKHSVLVLYAVLYEQKVHIGQQLNDSMRIYVVGLERSVLHLTLASFTIFWYRIFFFGSIASLLLQMKFTFRSNWCLEIRYVVLCFIGCCIPSLYIVYLRQRQLYRRFFGKSCLLYLIRYGK